jgi:hypothetical protein
MGEGGRCCYYDLQQSKQNRTGHLDNKSRELSPVAKTINISAKIYRARSSEP